MKEYIKDEGAFEDMWNKLQTTDFKEEYKIDIVQ